MFRITSVVGVLAALFSFTAAAAPLPGPVTASTPLAILAPDSTSSPEAPPFLAEAGQSFNFFAARPTREAAQRLAALDAQHEERVHYQTESPSEALGYVHANRDLIVWYLRALLRSRVGRLVRDIRQHLRDEQSRGENVPGASEKSGGQKPAVISPAAHKQTRASGGGGYSRAFSSAVRFIEHLTNDGVTAELEPLSARMRFNTQTSALNADLFSPILNVGLSYRLLSPEKPLPFSGLSPDGSQERLVLSGESTFPGLGVVGSVQYQYRHHSLNCSLSRVIVGPVSGQVERSWDFGRAGLMVSRASVSMSVYF